MRFWDSSAIVPLLVEEATCGAVRDLYRDEPEFMVFWSTRVECVSALTRRERDGTIGSEAVRAAGGRLDALADRWRELAPVDQIRRSAVRLLRVHPLRAADALQLTAAIAGSEDRPETLPLVTLDERLADAASREGSRVILPAP